MCTSYVWTLYLLMRHGLWQTRVVSFLGRVSNRFLFVGRLLRAKEDFYVLGTLVKRKNRSLLNRYIDRTPKRRKSYDLFCQPRVRTIVVQDISSRVKVWNHVWGLTLSIRFLTVLCPLIRLSVYSGGDFPTTRTTGSVSWNGRLKGLPPTTTNRDLDESESELWQI